MLKHTTRLALIIFITGSSFTNYAINHNLLYGAGGIIIGGALGFILKKYTSQNPPEIRLENALLEDADAEDILETLFLIPFFNLEIAYSNAGPEQLAQKNEKLAACILASNPDPDRFTSCMTRLKEIKTTYSKKQRELCDEQIQAELAQRVRIIASIENQVASNPQIADFINDKMRIHLAFEQLQRVQ